MYKLFTILFLLILSLLGYGQNYYSDFVDGRIWFRVEAASNFINQSQIIDVNNIPFDVSEEILSLSKTYSLLKLSKPFSKATSSKELLNTYLLTFKDYSKVDEIIEDLSQNINIKYAEKIPLDKEIYTPDDQHLSSCWSINKTQAELAWDISKGDSNIVVAIVEGAIQVTHEDLKNVLWINKDEIPNNNIDDDNNGYVDDINGWDIADNDADVNPPNNSWTLGVHVAGIAGAETDNAIGIPSIGFGISIMPIKSTQDASGPGFVESGYDAIYYAALNNANVINCSWGGTNFSQTGQDIVNWAWNRGSIVVAASGNGDLLTGIGINIDVTNMYPCNFDHVIGVASSASNDIKATSSNYGNVIDVTAPGVNIFSCFPGNNYTSNSGTSMASPFVAGLLGLMISYKPNFPKEQIISCMYSSCDNIDSQNPGYVGKLGAGRVNSYQAMLCLQNLVSNPPVVDFTYSNISNCSPVVSFSDLSTNYPDSWEWDMNSDGIVDYTSQNPTHSFSSSGLHTITLSVSNEVGSSSKTKTDFININADYAPSVDGASVCPGETTELLSISGNVLSWYDDQSTLQAIHSGSSFTTTLLNQSTTFYAAIKQLGSISNIGKKYPLVGAGSNSSNKEYLVFDVYKAIEIVSVEVKALGSSNRTIEIIDSSGNVVFQKTINIQSSGTHRVDLNAHILPGTSYKMGLEYNSTINLHRNTSNVSFPYSSGLMSITSSTDGLSNYYFFYDWEIRDEGCESHRVAIDVRVEECTGFTDLSEVIIYPNPNNGEFFIKLPQDSEGSLSILNNLGQIIHEEEFYITAESHDINLSSLSYGNYVIRLNVNGELLSRKFIIFK